MADRVEVNTGDMTQLPFTDNTFKRERPHWRYPGSGAPGTAMAVAPGTPNPGRQAVTRPRVCDRDRAATARACCAGFYAFHPEAGTGPMVNPFPLARGRRGRANAHRNPMQAVAAERAGRYRPKMARRIPRQIPDEKFGELFARLGSHRDRALVAAPQARHEQVVRLHLHRQPALPVGEGQVLRLQRHRRPTRTQRLLIRNGPRAIPATRPEPDSASSINLPVSWA